jgi:hypothetical protein
VRIPSAATASSRADAALTALFKGPGVVSFKGGEGSIEHFPARHDHYVQSRLRLENWSDLVAPEQLPRQPLRAISSSRRSQFAARRDPQSWVSTRVRNDDDGHEPRVKSNSFCVRAFEFRATANTFAWRQAVRPGHKSLSFVGDRQTLPSLGSPTLQHNPAVFRRHANPEPVRFLSAAGVRLKRTLSLHVALCVEKQACLS